MIYTAIKQDKKNWEQMSSKLELEHDVPQPVLNNTLCRRFRFIIYVYSLQKLCSVWVLEIQSWQYYRDETEILLTKPTLSALQLMHLHIPNVQCPGKKRFCNSCNKVHIHILLMKNLRNWEIKQNSCHSRMPHYYYCKTTTTEPQACSSICTIFLKKQPSFPMNYLKGET